MIKRCVHTLGVGWTKGQCLRFSDRLNPGDTDVFISGMTCATFLFPPPPPRAHTDRRYLNSERTWTVIPHRLHPCIFKEPKLCDTPITSAFCSERPAGWRKGKGAGILIPAVPKLPCTGGPVSFMASLHKRAAKSPSWGWNVEVG